MDISIFRRTGGVYLVSHDPANPPPYIGVVGSLHGNETCGLEVIHGLRRGDHPLRGRLCRGTLVLIHGNPAATEEGARHTRGGTDLNRLFDFRFETERPREAWTPEHWRAHELKPVIEGLDAVLDLHSTTSPSVPFVITGPAWISTAAALGCPFVTFGWNAPGLLEDRVLIGPLLGRNRPAFSAECGQHREPATVDAAWRITERFLEMLEVVSPAAPSDAQRSVVVEVVHRVSKPTANFRFRRPFSGFELIGAGEPIGEGDGIRLAADDRFHIMLPNQNVAVGEDMLYLGRPVPMPA